MSATSTDQTTKAQEERRPAQPRFLAAAGVLLVLAGFIAFMGIITAEALYPAGYSTSKNAISDLGATEPPDSVVEKPSATVFNAAMIVTGVLVLGAAFCLERGFRRAAVTVLTGLTGLGILGVGVFPGNYGNVHVLFALLTFAAGGLAAIVSRTVQTAPFSILSTVLGAISLCVLVLYMILGDGTPMAGLGIGGIERWIAYPILVWTMSFGGYLLGRTR
jgi:hypothetical membrane protein